MAPNLQGRILDKAADGSYVAQVSLNEEDKRLLDMMKAPEKKEETGTSKLIEKGVKTGELSSDVEELSKSIKRMEASVNKSTSIFSKGMGFVGGIFTRGVSEEEKYHKALIDLTTKLKVTEAIINSNSASLQELAVNNEDVARLLQVLSESSSDRENILEKILDREELNTEDASKLLESLDRSVEALGKVDATLDVNLSEVIDMYKDMIQDDRIDTDQRRSLLEEIKAYTKDAGISTEAVNKLNELNTESIKFDKRTTVDLMRLLGQISEDSQGRKITGTLEQLNSKYDKSILSQEELSDVLTKPTKGGKSFKESFLMHPEIYSKGETLKKGVIGTVLNTVGLGALESIGAVDVISDMISKEGAKKLGKGVKGAFEKVSDIFKPKGGIKGVEEVVGKGLEESDQVKVEQANLLDTVLMSQDILNNHSEAMEQVNKILGDKKKKNTLIHKLDQFDDTLEDTADNIEKTGKKSGGLFGSLFGGKGGKGGIGSLLGKGKGLLSGIGGKLTGLGGAMTGGLGLSGLLGSSMSGIASAGGGAIATSAGLVGLAGAAGYGVGHLLSKGIDKMIGRGRGGIGDWLYEKIHGTDEEQSAERETQMEQDLLARWQKSFPPSVAKLLGDDPKGVVQRLQNLKDTGQILRVGDKWMTAEEAGQVVQEKAEGKVEPTKEAPAEGMEKGLTKEIASEAVAVVEPTAEKAMTAQERLMQERALRVTGRVEPTVTEETKEIPADTISPEMTTRAQERLMKERAKKVTQAPAVKSPAPSSGRTQSIDDYSIALFNSMFFE